MIEDINLFPVLVRRIPNFLTNAECQLIIKNLDRNEFHSHDALLGNSISSHVTSQKDKLNSNFDTKSKKPRRYMLDSIEEYLPIKKRVLTNANNYAADMGIVSLQLDNSWANIQHPGSELIDHTHPLSAVSGAIYLNIDKHSSSIKFFNPNSFVDLFEVKKWTQHTFKTAYIPPTTGDMLLFPSWLKHGSNKPNESQERIVISFNTTYVLE